MSNFEIYRKTFTFSWQRLILDLAAMAIMIACVYVGYVIIGDPVIGMGSGFIIGIIIFYLIVHYFGYLLKAGQIAMMTRGVVEDKLPDNVSKEGKAMVKSRFATVSVYYGVTSAIKGIFNELTRGINRLTSGAGDTAEGVGSAISAVIQTAVAYLCDCCLGWVFYRKNESAFRSTCEGAVLYFKNWKTLIKNMGRVLGFGAVSFIIIGGGLTYGFANLLGHFPAIVKGFAEVVDAAGSDTNLASDPTASLVVVSLLLGIICWTVLHSVFVRPLVLVGVLRNYMKAGIDSAPEEADMAKLDGMSKKFRKMHEKAEAAEPSAA